MQVCVAACSYNNDLNARYLDISPHTTLDDTLSSLTSPRTDSVHVISVDYLYEPWTIPPPGCFTETQTES